MDVSETMIPAALLTTLCATSNMPMTIFHVLVTMRMAQAVLKIHRKKTAISMSSTFCQGYFTKKGAMALAMAQRRVLSVIIHMTL